MKELTTTEKHNFNGGCNCPTGSNDSIVQAGYHVGYHIGRAIGQSIKDLKNIFF